MKKLKIYTIYVAKCKANGKQYIGFDSNWPRRITEHKYNSTHLDRGLTQSIFHKAIKKYGIDNFEWEILYQSKERDHTLKVMEPQFIQEYNTSYPNGYNMTKGGDGVFGRVISDETRQKMSRSHSGIIVSEETRKKQSLARLGKPMPEGTGAKISAALKGRKKSQEHVAKMRDRKATEQTKSLIANANSKTIQLIKDGEIVTITNLRKFSRENNLNHSNLHAVYKGRMKEYAGFRRTT